MSFLLDTDICSAFLKNDRRVTTKVMLHIGGLHLSSVTVGELLTWARRANAPPARLQGVNELVANVERFRKGYLMRERKSGRVIRGVIIVTAVVATSVAALEVITPQAIRRIGLSLEDVLGGFFLAISIVIAASVCLQVNQGAPYIQGAKGPFTRQTTGDCSGFISSLTP